MLVKHTIFFVMFLRRKDCFFMIVDVHTHTFPDRIAAPTIEKLARLAHIKPFTDGSNSALLASMAQAGVDRSVVLPVATNIRQVFHVNDSAARLNQDYPCTGVLSLGCLHPDLPQWREELDRIVELGLKGIKLHPVYQDVDFDDPRYLRILERCGELGLVVLTHAGLSREGQLHPGDDPPGGGAGGAGDADFGPHGGLEELG